MSCFAKNNKYYYHISKNVDKVRKLVGVLFLLNIASYHINICIKI